MLLIVTLCIVAWFVVVLAFAFTFDQDEWDANQKASRYTADGDWRHHDMVREFGKKVLDKIVRW